MRFTSGSVAAAIIAFANAVTIENEKRAVGLEVTLAAAPNSAAEVVATVTNVGTESLNVLTLGTFLDTAPVQKLNVLDEASRYSLNFLKPLETNNDRCSRCLHRRLPYCQIH